jgi:hypothetical protein
MNDMLRSILANKIVELLLTADAFTLDQIAEGLVAKSPTKADILEYALGIAQRELLMAHGFSEKINQ